MDKGITLIGMPGSGKTTIGALVADKLDYYFLDVDQWIVERESMPLAEVIKNKSEQYILELEADCVQGNDLYEVVVSTPGSIIYTDSLQKLRLETRIIMLDVPFAVLEERLAADSGNIRGVIGLKEKGLKALFEERMPLYRKWAEATVNCEGKSAEQVVADIFSLII